MASFVPAWRASRLNQVAAHGIDWPLATAGRQPTANPSHLCRRRAHSLRTLLLWSNCSLCTFSGRLPDGAFDRHDLVFHFAVGVSAAAQTVRKSAPTPAIQ